jgi:hypothetical protein
MYVFVFSLLERLVTRGVYLCDNMKYNLDVDVKRKLQHLEDVKGRNCHEAKLKFWK